MIMKKKVLAMLMASVMVFSLTACGGSAETVAEETQQEEIVEESSAKEETVVETSPKEVVEEAQEVEKVEEPADDGAPVQPTSRTQYRSLNGGAPVEIPETITYNSDGSYVVTGTYINNEIASSYDIVSTYNAKGELIGYKVVEYSSLCPDGMAQEVQLANGYPVSFKYVGQTADGEVADNTADYVADGRMAVDGSGKLAFVSLDNYAVNALGDLYPTFYMESRARSFLSPRIADSFGLTGEEPLSNVIEYTNDKLYISYCYEGEGYNVETRQNEKMSVVVDADVISYNEAGLVESIITYNFNENQAGSVDVHDLSSFEPRSYMHNTYDSHGNLLETRGRAMGGYEMVLTYKYDDGASTVENENITSNSSAVSIEGRWRCQSENYPYDVIYFAADGTGNLYKGIDAYPLKYTFDGTKAYVTADGQEFTFYVYLDENLMVEGESDAPYDKEQ